MSQWTLELQSFRDHVTEIVFKDEAGALINIAGWFIKFDVVHDDGTITWSTVTGHVVIQTPTTNGKAILTVPKAEITVLPFDWADFLFYGAASASNPDLIYEGKAMRR